MCVRYFIMYKRFEKESYKPLLDNTKDAKTIRIFDTVEEAERAATEIFRESGTWFLAKPIIHTTTLK